MEPMDFDSFVALINEMTETKKVESPLSQLTSEELALIKAFDPDLVDEICTGKIAPSEAVLLARSATSNQEQEHVVKENASECASSALSGIFEAAEQRLENNREEAKKLKEEADAEVEDSDEGISDEEWEEDLDKKYEEIYNGKLSPNIADQVDLSNPKMHFKSAQDSDVQYVMDNDIPCAFWDYDEDWVEAGLLHAIDGMGNFIKDDETVWVHCAILDNVKKSSFNPEDPLDDIEDYKNIDESEDEIIVEEEMYFVPELKGKIGKIWQGEPTIDFNEAYEQALAECYMHEDSEIVIRDSLNRNVLVEANITGGASALADIFKLGGTASKATKAGKVVDDVAKASKVGKVTKSGKVVDDIAKASKTSKAGKAGKAGKVANDVAKAGKAGKAGKVASDAAKVGAGAGATGLGGWLADKVHQGVDAIQNTMTSLADQGSSITDTKGKVDGLNSTFNTDRI